MVKILLVGVNKRRFEVRVDFTSNTILAGATGAFIGVLLANLIM